MILNHLIGNSKIHKIQPCEDEIDRFLRKIRSKPSSSNKNLAKTSKNSDSRFSNPGQADSPRSPALPWPGQSPEYSPVLPSPSPSPPKKQRPNTSTVMVRR